MSLTYRTDELRLSCDRKVSPQNRLQPDGQWKPRIPNSFGLPSGVSCPGKTDFCKSCYGARMEGFLPWVGDQLEHNYGLLADASFATTIDLLTNMVQRFVVVAERNNAPLIFRIHWNGDFFSGVYAACWAHVCKQFPLVQFWAYTRSFDLVWLFGDTPNLRVYLSVDEHNVDRVPETMSKNPNVLLAYCARDFMSANDLARRVGQDRQVIACPENARQMPLVTDDGTGACAKCRVCIDGRADIQLTTSHRADATNVTIHRRQGRLAL